MDCINIFHTMMRLNRLHFALGQAKFFQISNLFNKMFIFNGLVCLVIYYRNSFIPISFPAHLVGLESYLG